MITRKTRKYLLITILLLVWAAGLFLFMQYEKYVVVNAKRFGIGFAKPTDETTREVGIPILLYHGIVKEADEVNITIPRFEEHMIALKEAGYTTIGVDELYAFYHEGAELPSKPVMITFDDGRRDSFVNSDAVLEWLGYKAVMTVVTDRQKTGNDFFLNWQELRLMHESGRWDIQAHAYKGHDLIPLDSEGNEGFFFSNRMWLAQENRLESLEEYESRVLDDLQTVKEDLENHIKDLEVKAFAFPFGDYGQMGENVEEETALKTCADMVKKVYPLSFELNYTGSDFNNYDDANCNLLRRIDVPGDMSGEDLCTKLENSRLKGLPYAATSFSEDELSHWFCNWGKVYAQREAAILANKDGESGAEFALYGGHYWEDYAFQTEISLDEGSASLIGRYINDDDFAFCGISGSGVHLGQKVGGEYHSLDFVSLDNHSHDYKIELEFVGDSMACRLDGKLVSGPVPIDPILSRGSVGFQVWNDEGGDARLKVRAVSVSEAKK